MNTPTPEQIQKLRLRSGLSQVAFGEMLHSSRRTVQNWEAGIFEMHPVFWEYAKIKVQEMQNERG